MDTCRQSSLYTVGVDEAGRGPLAGPVTAAAVVLSENQNVAGIADSKTISEKKREKLFERIVEQSAAFSIVCVGPRRIEHHNIREATKLAMKLAAERVYRKLQTGNSKLRPQDCFLRIDGNTPIETFIPQETIVKGDSSVVDIAAASILAKVFRDRIMKSISEYYPGYDFEKHKGYPTQAHRESIAQLGPSQVHRRTFAGVREHV
ncbi:MAG: ribonuclease HII [Bdellovibrionales bacterium]|nr:ribonuclease HII [Bdellovibrionales bacterium]